MCFLKKLFTNGNLLESETKRQQALPVLHKAYCPYCRYEFSKAPSRKKKCPNCGNYVFVRRGELLTEEQVNIDDWISRVESLGITKEFYFEHQQKLSQQFEQKASFHDTAWGCLNSLIASNIDNSVRSTVFREMATLVSEEGKSPTEYLKESAKYALLVLKKNSIITSVKVYNCNDERVCANCRKLEGKVFSMDQALKELPVPNVCKNASGCRCCYMPIVDIEALGDQGREILERD